MRSMSCDVAIIGCGPTGVMLANLLGEAACRVIVLDQASDVHPIPRATHIDEETQRNFQATGLMPQLQPFMQPFGAVQVVDERGELLFADLIQDASSKHGYHQSCFFYQPGLENVLRGGLKRFSKISLLSSVTARRVSQSPTNVTIEATQTGSDLPLTVNAKWLIGCDGGRSLVRESMGVQMQTFCRSRPWLIVDSMLNNPDDAALLPNHFRYFLNKDRLTAYAHGFGLNRRWEFQLRPDESLPDDATVLNWVSKFIDPNKLKITRITSYSHHALVAQQWRHQRMLLAGDAAHMMPPTAGQGMCSGIRDAVNLAWKLARIIDGRASESLLDTYQEERRPHVCQVLRGCLFLGNRLKGDTSFQRWWRHKTIRALATIQSLKSIAKRRGLPHPPLQSGCLARNSPCTGQHVPQVKVQAAGTSGLLDDALGYRFSLIARRSAITAVDQCWADSHGIGVWRLGDNLVDQDGDLTAWLNAQRLDYVLVRPDRVIFSAGEEHELQNAKRQLMQWIN